MALPIKERFPQMSSSSERDIVVHDCGCRLSVRIAAGGLGCRVLAILARAQQDKIAGDNLCAIFLFAALPVLPTCGLQLAFNVELGSFSDVLAYNLRQPLPRHDAVPFG